MIAYIIVPATELALFASKAPQNKTYRLSKDRVKKLVDTVKRATDSQIVVRDYRDKNKEFMEYLETWNQLHPDLQYTPQDIVRMVTVDKYDGTFRGTTSKDRGKEFHAFEGIHVPGFKQKDDVYIKFITPDQLGNVDVVSLHRSEDDGKMWDRLEEEDLDLSKYISQTSTSDED